MGLRALNGGAGHDMAQEITSHGVGDATVTKIPELALDAVEAGVFYPDHGNGRFLLSPEPRSQHRPRLHPVQLPGRTLAVLGRRDAPSAAAREAGLELGVL